MKKYLLIVLAALLLVIGAVSCNDAETVENKQDKTKDICPKCGEKSVEFTENEKQLLALLDVELADSYCRAHADDMLLAEIDLNSVATMFNNQISKEASSDDFSVTCKALENDIVLDMVFSREVYDVLEQQLAQSLEYSSVKQMVSGEIANIDVDQLFDTREVADAVEQVNKMGVEISLDKIVVNVLSPDNELLASVDLPVNVK